MILGPVIIVGGGREYHGAPISVVDTKKIREFVKKHANDVDAFAVTGVFSPAHFEDELLVASVIAEELGASFLIFLSHQVGVLGLLERENANILNASLFGVANQIVLGFIQALKNNSLDHVSLYLIQNDGTLITEENAKKFPIFMLGARPTNSMRGACALTNIKNAIVIDRRYFFRCWNVG